VVPVLAWLELAQRSYCPPHELHPGNGSIRGMAVGLLIDLAWFISFRFGIYLFAASVVNYRSNRWATRHLSKDKQMNDNPTVVVALEMPNDRAAIITEKLKSEMASKNIKGMIDEMMEVINRRLEKYHYECFRPHLMQSIEYELTNILRTFIDCIEFSKPFAHSRYRFRVFGMGERSPSRVTVLDPDIVWDKITPWSQSKGIFLYNTILCWDDEGQSICVLIEDGGSPSLEDFRYYSVSAGLLKSLYMRDDISGGCLDD
jgi:hypothetical protein